MIERELKANPFHAILIEALDVGGVNGRGFGAGIEFGFGDDIPGVEPNAFQPAQLHGLTGSRE